MPRWPVAGDYITDTKRGVSMHSPPNFSVWPSDFNRSDRDLQLLPVRSHTRNGLLRKACHG